MSNPNNTGLPDTAGTATLQSPRGKNSESNTLTYVIAAIGCFALACAVFIFSMPEERTGPPQESAADGALPQGHPDTTMGSVIAQITAHVQELRQAVTDNPDDGALRLGLANALYDLGQNAGDGASFREAVEHYGRYLETTPDDPNARTDMAYALFRTGDLDGAIGELYAVRKNHPDHQQSAFNLGLMYKEKDKPDSVLAYMEITARIDSTTNAGRAAMQVLRAYRGAH